MKHFYLLQIEKVPFLSELFKCFVCSGLIKVVENKDNSGKQLNFRRINHEIVVRDNKRKRRNQARKAGAANEGSVEHSILDPDYFSTRTSFSATLRPFKNIANSSGFSITGPQPYLVFYCPRSGLTPHPLWLDGPVTTFCSLKNSSITLSGFIYINKGANVRICTLPLEDPSGRMQIHYDLPWTLRKVQIKQTVHFICYHEESKTFAVVVSATENTNKVLTFINTLKDGNKNILPKSIYASKWHISINFIII